MMYKNSTVFFLTFISLPLDAHNKFIKYLPTDYAAQKRILYLPTDTFISSYPYITASTWRSLCNHILDAVTRFDPDHVKPGDILFVQIDFLEDFIKIHRPHIKHPYILLVHHFFGESDNPVPGPYAHLLDDPLLIAWFTHNVDIPSHAKLHPLPLGIADQFYKYGDKATFDACIAQYKNIPKKRLLLMNFGIHTYPTERSLVYNIFSKKSFCTNEKRTDLVSYLKSVAEHKFVLSPRGNGLDCFRTWETLLLGSYPVVKSSTLDPLFKDLPVVIINDWNEVTEDFLHKKYAELSARKDYNFAKLYMPYWLEQIQKIQKRVLVAQKLQ